MGEFRMPSLGADMDVGTVLEWRVQPGDTVHRGDIVAVVDTEKSDIEVEIFEDGVVEELLVPVGVEVPVGTPLARVGAADHAPQPGFVRASPLARREAEQRGVDLATVAGSGPGGAVLALDVTGGEPASEPAPTREPRPAGGRHAIAALMARSKREIPHFYLGSTVDVSTALRWLNDRNAQHPAAERLLPAALLLRATALAARSVPVMNGTWRDEAFEPAEHVHIGVAVSRRGGGLVAPALLDADTLPLPELMERLRDLVQRARAGSLRSSEMADSTITVTNLGDQGVDEVYGVIYPPQVALVGFGKIVERPWAVDGMLTVRSVVRVTLSADHRVVDGHDGARFLSLIDQLLQTPEAL